MGVPTLTVAELQEVEAIRKLRALYAHRLDGHDWDGLAELFAEDAVCEFTGGVGYSDWIGREFGDVGPMQSTMQGAPTSRFQGLVKTKDVCRTCNNEKLSQLDNYAKNLRMHEDRSPPDPNVPPDPSSGCRARPDNAETRSA